MKTLLTLSAILLFSGAATIAQQRSDRDSADLKGPVKSVRLLNGIAVQESGKWEYGPLNVDHYEAFDQQGHLVEFRNYTNCGLSYKEIKAWDNEGRNVRTEMYDNGVRLALRIEKEFNERGGVVVERTYTGKSSKPVSKETTSYDESGRKVTVVYWKQSNRSGQHSKLHNTYDTQGNLTSQVFYRGDGTVEWKSLMTIDTILINNNSKLQIRRTTADYQADDSLRQRDVYLYDFNGTLRTHQHFRRYRDHPSSTTLQAWSIIQLIGSMAMNGRKRKPSTMSAASPLRTTLHTMQTIHHPMQLRSGRTQHT